MTQTERAPAGAAGAAGAGISNVNLVAQLMRGCARDARGVLIAVRTQRR